MSYYIYLSVTPEALVVSMLPPAEFGSYLAVGTRKRASEQAIFFQLKPDFENDYFNMDKIIERCVPHENGQPKHSVYASTYRVLENVPLDAFGSLWLVTRDGLPFELKQAPLPKENEQGEHLYQELCPLHPLIASLLNPVQFCVFITDPEVTISVPKICFLELQLGEIMSDSDKETPWNLPYKNIKHLRDCLLELAAKPQKTTKTVDRIHSPQVPYRCIESGFFVGTHDTVLYYPFPSAEEMENNHHKWWRSAQLS